MSATPAPTQSLKNEWHSFSTPQFRSVTQESHSFECHSWTRCKIWIYWFEAWPFSLKRARMKKMSKNSQNITKSAIFMRFFFPSLFQTEWLSFKVIKSICASEILTPLSVCTFLDSGAIIDFATFQLFLKLLAPSTESFWYLV